MYLKKINPGMVFILLLSMISCSKKAGESVQPNLKRYDFSTLTGVPSFADLNLKQSSFILTTKALGDLQFDVEHQDKIKYGDHTPLFTGKVKALQSGMEGHCYLFSGHDGIQIGFDLTDTLKKKNARYQVRNISGMYYDFDQPESNPAYLKGRQYSQSIRKEVTQMGIPESNLPSIVLEETGKYELDDVSAFDEAYFSAYPEKKDIPHCEPKQMPGSADSKRTDLKSRMIYLMFYVVNGSPFGEYSFNKYVGESAVITGAIKELDYKNTMAVTSFYMLIDRSSCGLDWNSSIYSFLYNWTNAHWKIKLNDVLDGSALNLLCVGNSWNDGVAYSFFGTYGYQYYNVGVASAVPSVCVYTPAHQMTHMLSGLDNDQTYVQWFWRVPMFYQDFMRNKKFDYADVVKSYLSDNNKDLVRKNFSGY